VTDDEARIERTVLDYFEAWFDGDEERMRRALHPELAKRSPADDGTGVDHLTASEMIEATAAGHGRRRDPGERRIEIEVVDVHDRIGAVVVHSNVYREYLHVARTPDGWKIVNALWDWSPGGPGRP
jgi:ketosteroid isomerase-like protein